MDKFWNKKRVFLTGHTGFKGSWLSIWLNSLGAEVTGYALKPPTKPSLFELCKLSRDMNSIIADVRDSEQLKKAVKLARPEIIIHMAAQPLVRESYKTPRDTYETNVMGVVNLLEAVRACPSARAVVNITTDKCYENKERLRGYREDEPLGGYDPYSNSKACSELVTSAYRNSFFNPKCYKADAVTGNQDGLHHIALASARAGNVVGGGDWAADRLIPDIIRAALKGEKVRIRNPRAIRPWQHVLSPLSGYLLLAQKLYEGGSKYCGAWNFGPAPSDAKDVEWIVKRMFAAWPEAPGYTIDKGRHPHEAHFLNLDSGKARKDLNWRPHWDIGRTIDEIIYWTRAYAQKSNTLGLCLKQIEDYSFRK